MKFRLVIVLFLLAGIPMVGSGQSASSPFSLNDKSASSTITNGGGGTTVGYARILPNAGSTTPSGVAIFGYKPGSVLVTEAGVPASPLLTNGRIYAEVGPNGSNGLGTDIGLAIANPNGVTATINFSFNRSDGTQVGSGAYNLGAGLQFASYLDQQPWSLPLNFQGTFTFSSNVPISVIALQLYNNQRGESLITTLPVIDTTAAPNANAPVLSHFTDGSGWNTAVLLVNSTDNPMSGNIQFRAQNGSIVTLTANGQTASVFNYTIPGRSSFKLQTAGLGNTVQSGSVTVTPAAASNTPVALAVFSFANGGVTVTQAGVPASSGTAFRMYVEATPNLGAIGSYSTGFAVANTTTSAGTVTFDLYTAAGASTGLTTTLPIAALGQTARFLSDIFPNLSFPFQGILRVTTSTPGISVVALRIRYNERGEFLMTTTPPSNENASTTSAEFDFPDFVNGGGFTTQFILFSGINGQVSNGTLQFFNSVNGAPLPLTLSSTINGTPVTLASISPTTATPGSVVTLTGTGFSASNTVVFTTSSGTIDVAPGTVTLTTLTATVPANAVTGPVFVRNGAQVSASVALTVTAGGGGGGGTGTPVAVGAGANVAGVDIFVPAPAGTLLVTQVGVGDPNTSIGLYTASATVLRGQTNKLLVVCHVVSGACSNTAGLDATSKISVSGTGVTLGNSGYQNGGLFVFISVDANATPGVRNVIVTNTNGDIGILTGGLLIQ